MGIGHQVPTGIASTVTDADRPDDAIARNTALRINPYFKGMFITRTPLVPMVTTIGGFGPLGGWAGRKHVAANKSRATAIQTIIFDSRLTSVKQPYNFLNAPNML